MLRSSLPEVMASDELSTLNAEFFFGVLCLHANAIWGEVVPGCAGLGPSVNGAKSTVDLSWLDVAGEPILW